MVEDTMRYELYAGCPNTPAMGVSLISLGELAMAQAPCGRELLLAAIDHAVINVRLNMQP